MFGRSTIAICSLFGAISGVAQVQVFDEAMMTTAELSNYERTSTFDEVISVIDALDQKTTLMHRETLLLTREGRQVPIVVLADPPLSSPQQAAVSGKPVIYIQGNIHGGEVEGKEASLIAMRDILYGDKQHLLENQILIFVPVYNADGNDAMAENTRPNQELSPVMTGIRTAHGYDLNRDGMIVEADETRALYENVIQRWDPDLLVDLHTTNGTWHGYSLTYAHSYHTAGDSMTSDYTSEIMLPAIQQSVKDKFDLDFGWYGGYDYRDWPPAELRTFHHAPRYLTNNMALRNRMAILSETFSHDRFYKRVHAANAFVEEILEYTRVHGQEIRRINREADSRVAENTIGTEKGVKFEMVPRDEPLDLLTYSYIPYQKADGTQDFVRSSELVTIEGVANYNAFAATQTATVPSAYVFSAAFSGLANKLQEHGIWVETLEADSSFNGQTFVIDAIGEQSFVQNGHRNSLLSGSYRNETRVFSRGDFIVSMNHRLANLIFYLLEPESDDSLAYWNLFDEYLKPGFAADGQIDYPVFKVLD
ncbi:MAG: M14 family metallopeptidase [Proteobacteria bacterium]|nr:M14 family metallopeptidase [Pseudomonadota bacterium]MDA0927853.1 M14 family metallopeptidase [Pseudomonadota bacterium]